MASGLPALPRLPSQASRFPVSHYRAGQPSSCVKIMRGNHSQRVQKAEAELGSRSGGHAAALLGRRVCARAGPALARAFRRDIRPSLLPSDERATLETATREAPEVPLCLPLRPSPPLFPPHRSPGDPFRKLPSDAVASCSNPPPAGSRCL